VVASAGTKYRENCDLQAKFYLTKHYGRYFYTVMKGARGFVQTLTNPTDVFVCPVYILSVLSDVKNVSICCIGCIAVDCRFAWPLLNDIALN